MSQHHKVRSASWSGLPYVFDCILCFFGAMSLGILIGLTEQFYNEGVAGDEKGKQLASVLGFVAFAQACELAGRIWRMCCTAVTEADSDEMKKEWKRNDMSVIVPCGCVDYDDRCFAYDEKSPELLNTGGTANKVDRDEGNETLTWWKHRSDLPLRSVKRGSGEYRIAKVRQICSVAVIEDLDPTPRASEFTTGTKCADVAYDADCDSDSDNEGRLTAAEEPGWVLADECDQDGVFLWDEA